MPVIPIDEKIINKNIDFLDPLQNSQSQNYMSELLKDMCEGRICKIVLLIKRENKTSIYGAGISKEYNRKFKEILKNKPNISSRLLSFRNFNDFNDMLTYISSNKRIGGIIIENEDKDMFRYRYLVKGIICKREIFECGLNIIKIIDNLTT